MGVITCIHLGLKPKMPKQPSSHAAPRSDLFFVKELAGETPPTLAAMRDLYDHVTHLFSLTPWQLIGESELILTRDSQTGEQWWCSVMGSAGEVYSMHAYRGEEGLRSLRKIENEEIRDPGEVMASMDCLYVEFVPGSELSRRDRELLNALDHPRGKKMVAPVFRSIRPGFHPWYVNAEEARTLAECVRAVSFICSVVAADAEKKFWMEDGVYPLVTPVDGDEPGYSVDMVEPVLSPEPSAEAVKLPEELLSPLRGRGDALHGAMELEFVYSAASVGEANQRGRSIAIALAVDAESGIVYAPEVTESTTPPAVALAKVFVAAVQSTGRLPREIHVRNKGYKASLAPLMDSLGVKVRFKDRLPEAEQACSHLLEFMKRRQ